MDPRESASGPPENQEKYWVSCQGCGELFNAAEAPWCTCLTDSPTVACPHCQSCFCKTTPVARIKFWQAAPPVMWARRLKHFERDCAEPPLEEGNPLRRPLVLVVDDEPDTRRIAFHVLESLGYGVLLARDGVEGFRFAKEYRPDLVLSDQMMPHLDGKHLCRALKQDPATQGIRVIIMSGLYKKDSQRIEILKEYGADDFLTKPISFEKLGEVLACWLAPSR
jgi:CheY-like chemotaxis protein